MFIRRHNVILGVMVLLLVCMAGYLATRYARYDFRGDLPHDLEQRIARAKLGSKIVTTLPARPGDVYGRGLQTPIIMAASRQVPSCFIDPSLIKKTIKVGETEQLVDDKEALCELLFDLARILKLSVGDLNVHLALRKEEYAFAQERSYRQKLAAWREAPDGPKPKKKSTELRFCWIKHELTRAELDALKTWKTDLAKRAKLATKTMADDVGQAYRKTQRNKTRAVGIQYEWRRSYPNGSCGATVLGYLNRNNEPGGGIHSSMANLLLSKDGRMVQYADVKRRAYKVDVKESEMPQDGCNIYLSIDLNIQNTLEKNIARACKKFEAQWGTGVVINPWTGDILAMANVPNYDPNLYNILPREEHHRMLNRAICMPYEPGSIFKPMIAASAVQLGTVNWDTIIDTGNGTYHAPRGGRISDHGARYGKISVRTGVVKSSNILMAIIGGKLGNQTLHSLLGTWGFGQETNICLPGESGGIVRPLDKWDGYSTPRVPIGQEVSTTALQVAMAYGAIANGGLLMQPRLVQKIVDANGKLLLDVPAHPLRRVLSKTVANQTLGVLEEVVQRGTGKNCKVPGYRVFGKTGTAQVAGVGGYLDGAYCGSFVGGAPAENPALICLISIYRPNRRIGYYGGTVAAPAVREVLERSLRYLQIPTQEETSADSQRPHSALDVNAGIRAGARSAGSIPIPSVSPGSERTWGALIPGSEIFPPHGGLTDTHKDAIQ